MDTSLAELRLQIYGRWIATGRAPAVDELSAAMQQDVAPGLDELAEAHTIVLEPVTKRGTRVIRMAHPFSGVPTGYRVRSGGISYWANCAWDCLGIAALLGRDTEAVARCADCGDRIDLSVRGGQVRDSAVIHLVVPARRAWDDIVFTWANIHAFRSEEHVDQWCERTWMARGATMTLEQCWRLSQLWYAERLAPNWHQRDAAERQALFAEVGLTGPFWLLPSQWRDWGLKKDRSLTVAALIGAIAALMESS